MRMGRIIGFFIPWLVFVFAAVLEVGGDAVIRRGLRREKVWFVLCGCLLLMAYGLVVNLLKWDFSRLLGVYIAVFALVTVLVSRFVLGEKVPPSTWAGLGLIVLGGLIIQGRQE
jgi:small multidrug resistance family-3 protein